MLFFRLDQKEKERSVLQKPRVQEQRVRFLRLEQDSSTTQDFELKTPSFKIKYSFVVLYSFFFFVFNNLLAATH
jgi:hypothetical protein